MRRCHNDNASDLNIKFIKEILTAAGIEEYLRDSRGDFFTAAGLLLRERKRKNE